MSHLVSRWLLVAAAGLLAAPFSHAQYPAPYGYYPPQPFAAPHSGYGVMPASMHRHQPAPYPPTYPYAEPQGPAQYADPACVNCGPRQPPVALFDGHRLAALHNRFAGNERRGPIIIDSLPTHPYARSPRDFFMFYENLEAERSRDLRPALIP